MATVNELFIVTKELLDHLKTPLPKEEREPYIEKVEELLETRQRLLNQFQGNVAAATDKQKAETIVQWNKEIAQRLQIYLNTIKIDMNKLKQQKDTGMKYENPYNAATDGFFIDKKN